MISISQIITQVGSSGPIILLVIASYLLWNKPTLLFYYQVGFATSLVLNLILKGIIKQPRPSEHPKEFDLALKNATRFIFKNGMPHDIFGMPSGHAQSAMFTTAFIFIALRNTKITILFFLMTLLIMYQRVKDYQHTVIQVIAGAFVGALYAYLFYYFAQQKLKGIIKLKADDNAPI